MNNPQEHKEISIIVNGRQKIVTKKELSFAEIIALAFDNPPTGPNIFFTVTYRKGEGNKPEGTLVDGETIKIRMEWFLMSQQQINRSPDLKQLQDDGYEVEIKSNYLLIKNIPYVNSRQEIGFGTLVSELTLAGDVTTTPNTHVAMFSGEYPCNKDGTEIAQIKNSSNKQVLSSDLTIITTQG